MKTSCEFHFGFWDVTARAHAHFAASQNQAFARVEDINREEGITFPDVGTLEPDFGWLLDGRKECLPDDAEAHTWGWWSTSLSGKDLSFLSPPTLTVTFFDAHGTPTPHSSAGITITFVATLPKVVRIQWYGRQGDLLADRDFTPDRFDYFCDCQVENYYKVVIMVRSMQRAYRFFRASGILFGAFVVLGGDRMTKAALTEEVSPVGLTLPITRAAVSFFASDGRFALLHPTGAYQLFQWRQELTGYKLIDGKRPLLGKYYLQQAVGTVDAATSLDCVDIIGVLDALEYKGGIYDKMPLDALLADILNPEGVDFTISPAFTGVTVSGYLPICSKRAALQQLAFAVGAMVDTARGEAVQLCPAPTAVTTTITPARKVVGHKVTMETLVTQVDVTAHHYMRAKERKELRKTVLDRGEHTITFSAPVAVESVTGATLGIVHPNYCTVTVVDAGEVVLYGYEYVDTQTVYTVKTDELPAGAKPGVKRVSNATLVDPGKAPAVARRLYDYYQLRYTDEGQLLPGQERVGELARVSSLGGKTLTGYIQRMVTDLTGGCLETVTIRGK